MIKFNNTYIFLKAFLIEVDGAHQSDMTGY